MIVLEGPDGAGKTTLLANLLDMFPGIEEHARASSSVGGPLPDIHEWAKSDLATHFFQPLAFYDRHPMISEPIYGSIVRDFVHEWFSSEEAQGLGQSFLTNTLLVICLPTLEAVLENIRVDDQMDGVDDHIEAIYNAYKATLVSLKDAFPYNVFHYDYTIDTDLEELYTIVEAHETRYNRKQNGRIA